MAHLSPPQFHESRTTLACPAAGGDIRDGGEETRITLRNPLIYLFNRRKAAIFAAIAGGTPTARLSKPAECV
jgi:hypothetical protein